ncbi:MAG: hypothetical protein ACR2QF_12320 [Geminicoccaceae bacterium]
MAKGVGIENGPKKNGHGTRFASTCGTEDGKVLTKQLVRNRISRKIISLSQRAKTNGRDIRLPINQQKLVLLGHENGTIQSWVFGNATLKTCRTVRHFTEKLDLNQTPIIFVTPAIASERGHDAEASPSPSVQTNDIPDFHRVVRTTVEQTPDHGSCDRNDMP